MTTAENHTFCTVPQFHCVDIGISIISSLHEVNDMNA